MSCGAKLFVVLIVLFISFGRFHISVAEEKTIFDHYLLIRSIDYLGAEFHEGKLEGEGAVAIIPQENDQDSVKLGDEIFIITASSGIVKGTVTQILEACGYANEVSCALLRLNKKIGFDGASDSLLGVRAKYPSADSVGSIKKLPKDYANKYSESIRKHLSSGETFYIDEAINISLPNSKTKYDFLSVVHHNIERFKTEGDKDDEWTSFLFITDEKKSKLLTKTKKISSIIGIVDLDQNGVYEVLVTYNNSAYEVSYEMRLFDGKKLSETKKVLYYWMD